MKPGFSTKIRQEALPQRPATGLPCSGRLLHEPRAVLAGDCAYCTNPRTPRSTPTPRPVGPDPRALRPGEVRTPRERSRPSTSKPSAAHLLPRVRVSPIWRRGRDSNPRCARRTAVFKTATFGRSVTSPAGPPQTPQILMRFRRSARVTLSRTTNGLTGHLAVRRVVPATPARAESKLLAKHGKCPGSQPRCGWRAG